MHILRQRQAFCPVRYELLAVHVDMGHSLKNTKALQGYFKKSGYKYVIKKLDLSSCGKPPSSLKPARRDSCFWCFWNRRKALFAAAEEYKCNKVALGDHKDDIIQTVLLNLFFNGEISTMSPKQELFDGLLMIIRPFAYAQENEIASFAREKNCPYRIIDAGIHLFPTAGRLPNLSGI
ncbi:MAG: ATP-binding protein [Candidatus Omnitrophota bacterium]